MSCFKIATKKSTIKISKQEQNTKLNKITLCENYVEKGSRCTVSP